MRRTGCCGCPFNSRFEEDLEIVKQYEPFCGVCCNCDSEHRADFRLKDETCEE